MAVFSFPFVWIIILGLFVAVALATYYLTTPSSSPPGPTPTGDADIVVDFSLLIDNVLRSDAENLQGSLTSQGVAPTKPFTKQIVKIQFKGYDFFTIAPGDNPRWPDGLTTSVQGIAFISTAIDKNLANISLTADTFSSSLYNTPFASVAGLVVLGVEGAAKDFTITVDFGIPVTDSDLTGESAVYNIVYVGPNVAYANYNETVFDTGSLQTFTPPLRDSLGNIKATTIDPTLAIMGYNFGPPGVLELSQIRLVAPLYDFSVPIAVDKLFAYLNGVSVISIANPISNTILLNVSSFEIEGAFTVTVVDTSEPAEPATNINNLAVQLST
jgi:hypothetical protein